MIYAKALEFEGITASLYRGLKIITVSTKRPPPTLNVCALIIQKYEWTRHKVVNRWASGSQYIEKSGEVGRNKKKERLD